METKVLITSLFLIILLIHTFTKITVDNISIILILLSFLPWFIQYIKSLEIAGLGKVELITKEEFEKIKKNAINAGLIKVERVENNQDPQLVLADLRMKIENKLRSIAKVEDKNVDIMQIIDMLIEKHTLTINEAAITRDLAGVLNKAVHSPSKKYNELTFKWIYDLGLKLLSSLENKSSI